MKKILLLVTMAVAFLIAMSPSAMAQQNMRDVVYLKNGSIIKGIIVEQVPNVSYKIKTADGSVFVYSADEVEKITKEIIQTKTNLSNTKIGGTIGICYANEGGDLNPGIGGNIFFHHPTSKSSFLSINIGIQYYSVSDVRSGGSNFDVSFTNIPITIGINGSLLNDNNNLIYLGIEAGMLIEELSITDRLNRYENVSATNSGFMLQPVFGVSIPLSKSINFEGNVKPIFIFHTDAYNIYNSTSINVGISFKLEVE